MVRFTAVQTDGFKSNDLPSTKIAIWPNKKNSAAAASLVSQSIFSFIHLLKQLQDARFGYCPILFLSTVCEESHETSLRLQLADREQHRSPPTTALATRPLRGATHRGFFLQVSTDSAFPSFIKTTL